MGSAAALTRSAMRRFEDPRTPVAVLALLAIISGGLIVFWGSQLTFYLDEWALLLKRPGYDLGVFLEPHIGHPAMGLMAEYRFLQATLGMDSTTPYYVVSASTFVLSAALLFVYMRRALGPWLALAGAAAILFLGSAHEDLLITFQVSFFVPMSCGIATLLLLQRNDRAADPLVALLLVAGLLFGGLGLAFLPAAFVAIVLTERRLSVRLWVVALPAALFLLWYAGYGDAGERVSFDNLATAPGFILDGFASATSALLGLATPRDDAVITPLDWGRPLLVALIAGSGFLLARRRHVEQGFWVVLAAALSFWLLVALSANDPLRSAVLSRYQYVGAIFILLLAAELLRGIRPGPRIVLAVGAVVAVASVSNLSALHGNFETRRADAEVVRGGLAALEISRDEVEPAFQPDDAGTNFIYFDVFTASQYLAASEAYGNLGYELDELPTAPAPARLAADQMLLAALDIELTPGSPATGEADCERVRLDPLAPTTVPAPPGGTALLADDTAAISLRRYGDDPVPIGDLARGEPATLALGTDRSDQPWELSMTGEGPIQVCPLTP